MVNTKVQPLKNKAMKKQYLILCLLLWFVPELSNALGSDKQQPANLLADSAVLNRNTGVSVYRGNVKLTQGTTIITGDVIVTYTDKHNQLLKAVATGTQKLASYTTMPDNSKLLFTAIAQTINYYPNQGQAEFIGEAKATQGRDSFVGPQINYDINHEIVTSPSSHQGRTTIIIQPNQKQE